MPTLQSFSCGTMLVLLSTAEISEAFSYLRACMDSKDKKSKDCKGCQFNLNAFKRTTRKKRTKTAEWFIYTGDSSDLTSITLSSPVNTIGECAFYHCRSLTSIILPTSLTSIEKCAFVGCSSLASITLPTSLMTIKKRAFDGCTSLTSIILPTCITTIELGVFMGCSSLTSITIPTSVTTIEQDAFHLCTSLTSITLPSSITTIGHGAFRGCTNLVSIKLSSSLTNIATTAFYDCPNLTTIEIPPSIRGLVLISHPWVQGREVINSIIGTLEDVMKNMGFLSPTSLNLFKILGIRNEEYGGDECQVFINCKIKQEHGRFLLYTALEHKLKWSDGLDDIYNSYGAAIEDADVMTGFEAFMLAAVESNSNLDTVYRLLQNYPAAIIPCVR